MDSNAKFKTVLLFGAPGSGKGTLGKALGAVPGFVHLACGEVFRDLDMTTDLGQIFVEYSSRGLLVPDDATVKLWRVTVDAMVSAHRYRPASDILVLDGIPRNVEQAHFLDHHVLSRLHLKESMTANRRCRWTAQGTDERDSCSYGDLSKIQSTNNVIADRDVLSKP